MPKKSVVSLFLKLTAVLILVAGIAGGFILIAFLSKEHPSTAPHIGIPVIAAGLIISLLMLGVAKMIDTLRQQQYTLDQIVDTLREQQLTLPNDSELEEVLPEF